MIISAPFIILEKKPYREAGLILRGLSPDYGKISLILHGGQSLSKSAPLADIFREVEVEFEDDGTGRDLFTARRVETIQDYSAVAENSRNYRMAVKIAAFLLDNTPPGDIQLHTYEALKAVLSNLAGTVTEHPPWSLIQCSVVIKSTFLCENGMLPEGVSQQQNEFMEILVASGMDNAALPECNEEYWSRLNSWLNELISLHRLKK